MTRRDTAGDVILAGLLALTPLLPYGPRYLGLDSSLVELIPVALLAVWLFSAIGSRSRGPRGAAPGDSGATTILQRAWIGLLIPISGALVVGLVAENRIGSPVFAEQLWRLTWSRVVAMDMFIDPLYSGRVWLTFAGGFLTFWLVGRICAAADDPGRRARRALLGWVAGFAIVSILAVAQYLTRYQLHHYWVRVNPNLTRAHSTLDDPNALAAYLLLGVGACLGIAWSGWGITWSGRGIDRWRHVWHALVACGTIALFTTVSRTAWIALAAALLVIVALRPSGIPWIPARQRRRFMLGARAILVVGITAASATLALKIVVAPRDPLPYAPSGPVEAVLQTIDPRVPLDQVLSQRFGWWSTALRIGARWPLTGAGLGRYPRLVEEFRPARSTTVPENSHNLFLQLFAECGALGAAGLAAFVGCTLRAIWLHNRGGDRRTRDARGAPQQAQAKCAAAGLTLGCGAYVVTFLAAHPLLLPSHQILFGSLLATWCASTLPVPMPEGGQNDAHQADGGRPHEARYPGWLALGAIGLLCGAAYLARAATAASPPAANAPWGYSAGLYPVEANDTERPFRWTSELAIIEARPAEGVRTVELTLAVARPVEAGFPVETRVSYGPGSPVTRFFSDSVPTIQSLQIPVDPLHLDRNGILLIRIEVTPAFLPALIGESNDRRRLGVRLWPLRYLE